MIFDDQRNIYVNTTQFNVDTFVIDIYYLFQNQKIKNTSISNFNLTCKTYFHWLRRFTDSDSPFGIFKLFLS
jgi:hypothetical protein